MHIEGMTIGGIPPFTEPVEFEFDERVNVFIGPNSTGKSTILLQLAGSFCRSARVRAHVMSSGLSIGLSEDWPIHQASAEDHSLLYQDYKELPAIFVPSIRVGSTPNTFTRSSSDFISDTDYRYDMGQKFAEDVAPRSPDLNEILYGQEISPTSVFNAERVEHATMMMLELDEIKNSRREGGNFLKAVYLVYQCSQNICREILQQTGEIFHHTHTNYDITKSGIPRNIINIRPFTVVPTSRMAEYPMEEIPGDGWTLPSLSSGVEGSVWWIRFVSLNMAYHYEFADGWETKPAMLFIDEIENHLHPTWQRRVIPALLEYFPGLQIFAATHSPFVVAGLKAGQVHLLNRDENGVVRASTNTEDIVGWTADEILRVYMGVDDPTDVGTARNAAELRRLRDEGPRSDEREEEARQARMQELRRLVDRDLLAGGPMARRRAEFSQRFSPNPPKGCGGGVDTRIDGYGKANGLGPIPIDGVEGSGRWPRQWQGGGPQWRRPAKTARRQAGSGTGGLGWHEFAGQPQGLSGGRVGRRRRAVRLVGEWRAIGPGRD